MIRNFLTVILLAFAALSVSCNRNLEVETESLADKCAPFEFFSFQRSYPDPVFDWRGWQKTLSSLRQSESALARPVDCAGHAANWTEQGPANVGARCNTLAVKPNDENTVLAGFSGGGIFKTTDGGVNWKPVFDDHPELCIAHIVFDQVNPNIVYAGTGDPNLPAIVFNGDGIYKSYDAGETWQYLGLSEAGIISKIVTHPSQPKTLVVAAMGNPYVRDDKRGVFKSRDGGQTWERVLFISNQAGASDLVQSPANPDILYASFWDRIRNNQESVIYGPNAKVYKSEDGGDTWKMLGNGLPNNEIMGRTGLAVSKTNPDKLYVVYIDTFSTPGYLMKTSDGGDSWDTMNINSLGNACGDFGWYFGKIRLNPADDEDLYFLAITLHRKLPGSTSWISAGGGHADSHDLVFAPSGKRYWANDGGVYRNNPGQQIWVKCNNLPVTQFYHTDYNPHQPNLYYGGAQDNGIQKGKGGADINNWSMVFTADGFNCAFHPTDPLTFWVETQNGTIHRTTDGGNNWDFGSVALGSTDRVNWDAPFFISKYNAERLYSATYRAYLSTGTGWAPISPDLTKGIIYGPRFHTVSALNESPLTAEKLMAGTSDGNVWRREPSGSWVNITGTLPNRYVTSVHMSPTLPQRLYVTQSGFRDNENIPHIHRSDDNGAHWIDITGNLPIMPVNDLLVMPGRADSVLFAATDAGVYFTRNFGSTWNRLGANMPFIPVFDLEENPVRKELMAATHARGIWTFPFDSVFAQQPAILVTVSGKITTELGEGVNDVRFGANKSHSDGTYNIDNVPGCSSIVLNPYRNDNLLNGLTTYDLVLISKNILGIEPLGSPYKLIAADANRSNSVTTSDIVALRKIILGIDDTLAGNTSWRFLPKTHVFSNLTNPFQDNLPTQILSQLGVLPVSNLDFTAIKVGDVNNSVVPGATGAPDDRSVGDLLLEVPDATFQKGDPVEVLFSLPPGEITALQFSLQFDRSKLAFEKLEPLIESITPDQFAINRLDQGLVSVALSLETPVSGTPLFRIRFKALSDGMLSDALALRNAPTTALAYRADGTELKPRLWGGTETTVDVSPNPFGSEGIRFDIQLEQSNGVTPVLEVLNAQGRIVFSRRMEASGTVRIPASHFGVPGVYFWRLNGGRLSGKLVFLP